MLLDKNYNLLSLSDKSPESDIIENEKPSKDKSFIEDVSRRLELQKSAGVQRKTIDIVPLLECIELPVDEWLAFVRLCRRGGISPNDYLSIGIKQEIENALKEPYLVEG